MHLFLKITSKSKGFFGLVSPWPKYEVFILKGINHFTLHLPNCPLGLLGERDWKEWKDLHDGFQAIEILAQKPQYY
jgi:hypothetical protein